MHVQVLDLKFLCEFAAQFEKVQIHRTGILTSLATTNFPFTLLLGRRLRSPILLARTLKIIVLE